MTLINFSLMQSWFELVSWILKKIHFSCMLTLELSTPIGEIVLVYELATVKCTRWCGRFSCKELNMNEVLPSCPSYTTWLVCLSRQVRFWIKMMTEKYVMRQNEMYFRLFILKWCSNKIQFDPIIGTSNFPARASIDYSTTDFITYFRLFILLIFYYL